MSEYHAILPFDATIHREPAPDEANCARRVGGSGTTVRRWNAFRADWGTGVRL